MTLSKQIEIAAKVLADSYGRDWSDMGEYEREAYRDEARRRLDDELPRNMDEPADCIMRSAETPFAANH